MRPSAPHLLMLAALVCGCGNGGPGYVSTDDGRSGGGDGAGLEDGASPDADQVDGNGSGDGDEGSGDGDDGAEPAAPAAHAVLFVGNSYTAQADLPGRYGALASASPDYDPVDTRAVTAAGYRLDQHAADAEQPGSALSNMLGTALGIAWSAIVLQGQSQVPGFGPANGQYLASAAGAQTLIAKATENGALPVLLMTWGRRDGDRDNDAIYPDFSTMQARLETGYRAFAAEARAAGHDARLAPVGVAFRLVHEDTSQPDAFAALYADDGSHPSAQGSYLAACVVYATITGQMPSQDAVASRDVDAARAAYLRRIAVDAVAMEPEPAPLSPDGDADAGAP